jgi:hypothetical protein
LERHWILGVVLSFAGLVTLLITHETTAHVAVLVMVGTGWGVIVWRLEALFRTKVRESQETAGGLVGLSNEFHVVLDQFSDTFDDQFTKAEHELGQLRHLMGDAVQRLTQAVTFLKEQIEAQHGLLEEVAGHSGSLIRRSTVLALADGSTAPAAGGGGRAAQVQDLMEDIVAMSDRLALGVAELWRVKGTLEATLGDAVMALQFEDISAQLVGHVVDRIEYLKTLLTGVMKIEEGLDTKMSGAEVARTVYEQRLDSMREALRAAALLVDRVEHVAVHQRTLDPGEVELF